MEFAAHTVLSQDEALDLAEAMHLASQELRRLGRGELAHRLRGRDLILAELLAHELSVEQAGRLGPG